MSILQSLSPTKEPLEMSRGFILWFIALGICVIMINGCGVRMTQTTEHGLPIDETTINEIVIGKTTRSELFKLLGTPHSIFQGQAEFVEGHSVPSINQFYSHEQNRYLSSIDEEHYAFLYRFGKTSSESTMRHYIVSISSKSRIKIKSDELLLFIDRKTNIVDDVAYRKETSEP